MLNVNEIIAFNEALRDLYPSIVTVSDNIAYDADGNEIVYNAEEVNVKAQKNICKQKASELLYETDWTTIPDVADSSNTPYLTNQAEFIAWRSQIRALAVNPVVDPVFPPKPDEVWG